MGTESRPRPLNIVRGAGGDHATVVDDGDVVGQPVGLVQVLGREQDGRSGGGQVANDGPQFLAAARVQPGGGLVQEQHPGLADQADRQVQSAAHAPGVAGHRPVPGLGQAEPVQQRHGAVAGTGPGKPEQPADQDQVLRAGQFLVQRGVLAGQRDELTYLVCPGDHVVPVDPGGAAVRAQQGGQDPHGGGLARPVGAEQPEYGPGTHGQVHSGQCRGVSEPFHQALGLDGVGHLCSFLGSDPTTVAGRAGSPRTARWQGSASAVTAEPGGSGRFSGRAWRAVGRRPAAGPAGWPSARGCPPAVDGCCPDPGVRPRAGRTRSP